METLAAFTSCGSTRNTFDFSYFCSFAYFINDKLCSHFATFYVIGSDVSYYFAFISRAVNSDYRNVFSICCFYRSRDSCRVYRVDDQYGNAAFKQVGNVVSLFSWVVLSINDFNFKTKRFSLSLNTFFHSYEEWVVQCGNREADRAGFFVAAVISAFTTACYKTDNHDSHRQQ